MKKVLVSLALVAIVIGCTRPVPKNAAKSASPSTSTEVTSAEAAVGAGAKGHGYGTGPIAASASTYWRAQEKIAFEIAVPHAVEVFKALDPKGKGPKTHEEFMEKIIKENNIKLPELPQGASYRYDPETETLMIDTISEAPAQK